MVMFNFTNEMAYTTLKLQGHNIVPYLSKFVKSFILIFPSPLFWVTSSRNFILTYNYKWCDLQWADLCKAYLLEAKWFYEGHKPTFDEYMNNAWITISGPLILSCAFFLMNHEITKERLALLNSYPDLIRTSAYAFRLLDDLGTANVCIFCNYYQLSLVQKYHISTHTYITDHSKTILLSQDELARGDVLKAVQCYMHEKGVSEQAAREYVKYEISESWKKLNKHFILGSMFPRALVVSSMDVLRISHWFYAYGDGFGSQRERTFDVFKSIAIEPIDGVAYE